MTDYVVKDWPGPEGTHCVDTAEGQTVVVGSFDDCIKWALEKIAKNSPEYEADLKRAESGQVDSGSLAHLNSPPGDWGDLGIND